MIFKKIKRLFNPFKARIINSTIGENTYIGNYSIVNDSRLGKFCSIADFVRIGPYNHCLDYVSVHPFLNHKAFGFLEDDFFDDKNLNETRKEVIIGNDVWIGSGVVVLRGVQIGDGAVIGANAVVNTDIPPYAIAVGVPAKVIKYRFDQQTINKLLSIEWWNWDKQKIKSEIKNFYDINDFV